MITLDQFELGISQSTTGLRKVRDVHGNVLHFAPVLDHILEPSEQSEDIHMLAIALLLDGEHNQ